MIKQSLPNEKEINEKNTYYLTEMSFKTIINLIDNHSIELPIEQGGLNEDTIKDLINDYKLDKAYFYCRNNIVIGVLNQNDKYKYYIVDGQHRINMARELLEKYNEDETFKVNFKYCKNKNEIRLLFEKLNKDSNKNNHKLNLGDDFDELIEEIKKKLKKDYDIYFTKSASKEKKIFTIDEFLKEIIKNKKFMEKFDTCDDFINFLIDKNKKFNKHVNEIGYKQLYINDEDQFYQDEVKILKNTTYYTIGFKNNNFITNEKYLFKKDVIPEHHTFKKQKGYNETVLRKKVWIHEFGNKKKGDCPVYLCDNEISDTNFNVGHIISEANGGERVIENLRPICTGCNSKMGKMNWNDYVKKLKQNKKKYETDSDSDSSKDTKRRNTK